MKETRKDSLNIKIYSSRAEMGKGAEMDIKSAIIGLLANKDEINMIFAAAPSQNEVLAELAADKDIQWGRINAYHMDEYIGLPTVFLRWFHLRASIISMLRLPTAKRSARDIRQSFWQTAPTSW